MSTRLQRLCDVVMEASWLTALIVAPLFFNVYSQRVFEPDKISLVRTLALIALIAWVVKKVDRFGSQGDSSDNQGEEAVQRAPWWRQPLLLPVLILAIVYLFSTALSITPRQSFWGSYQRLQGTFTMFSYMALFWVVADTMRTSAQWRRLQYTVIITSLPIALYGILQRAGLDPLPWGGDTIERVAANMGNSIFLAAYLIMAIPLTLERLITAARRMLLEDHGSNADALVTGALLFVFITQLIAIFLTQSRGPWIGLGAGIYVFLLLSYTALRQRSTEPSRRRDLLRGVGFGIGILLVIGLLAGSGLLVFSNVSNLAGLIVLLLAGLVTALVYLAPFFIRRAWSWAVIALITQAIIVIAFLGVLNTASTTLARTPLGQFTSLPYVGRLAQLTDMADGTGRVRVLIWQGAINLITPHEPIVYPDQTQDRFNVLRPLIGYGPEAMWVAYNRYYVPELAGLENRNASPDRSHNETFDSLVITGMIGFLAYLALFAIIFLYALRWLGLIQTRRDGTLFLASAGGLALLGVIVPALLGMTHLGGIGVAIGFILGAILYITIAAFVRSTDLQSLDRHHLLIIALLAVVVAHFVEIHFGIAIVATRTYFFIFIASLSVIGYGRMRWDEEQSEMRVAQPISSPGRKRSKRSRRALQTATTSIGFWRRLLPYMVITAIIFLVLDWNYISNQTGLSDAVTVFWLSWVTHLVNGELVSGPGALWLILFTGMISLILAIGEEWLPTWSVRDVLTALAIFLAITLATWVLFGFIMANRLLPLPQNLPLQARADFVAGHITVFYSWLLIYLILLAGALWFSWPRPASQFSRHAIVALVAGAGLTLLAFLIITNVNIDLVRADIYFKLGQNSDARQDWRTSQLFYDQSVDIAPREDHYQLFRGRALLENARRETDPMVQAALFDRALEVLTQARSLNPLNTDHSANLARYYATRATLASDPDQREQLLQQASQAYEEATTLSPNAAHLQNEWATVYLQLGDLDNARDRFETSLALDQDYHDTYLRLAQLETEEGNLEEALAAYTRAAELRPKDPRTHSGRGFILARLGRTDEAIAANLDVLAITPNDTSTMQNLALLFQSSGQFAEALEYAERVRAQLPEDQRFNIDGLIDQLRQQMGSN